MLTVAAVMVVVAAPIAQEKIDKESIKTVRWYNKEKVDGNYVPMPILGPDLIDVRRNAEIRDIASTKEGA